MGLISRVSSRTYRFVMSLHSRLLSKRAQNKKEQFQKQVTNLSYTWDILNGQLNNLVNNHLNIPRDEPLKYFFNLKNVPSQQKHSSFIDENFKFSLNYSNYNPFETSKFNKALTQLSNDLH